MVASRAGPGDQQRRGQPAAADRAPRLGVGGDLAASADGAALGAGHGRAADRGGDVHQPRPGSRRAAQLQRRRVRLAETEVRRRAATEVRPRPARADQEDRAEPAERPRAAVLDLEPVRSWPTSWSPRGWSTTSPTRACGRCCARRASPFQAVKTWKTSTDPDYEAKKNRVLELYAIADGTAEPGPGDPTVVICMDEFGPLNLQPHPGKQWAPAAVGTGDPDRGRGDAVGGRPTSDRTGSGTCWPATTCPPTGSTATSRPARAAPSSWPSAATCAPCTRPRCGSRSCWTTSARTCRPRPTPGSVTGRRRTTSNWPTCPFYGSWLNRIEAQFTALRYFALDGTDHASHREQASMIRRYIAWRNRHVTDPTLRKVVNEPRPSRRAKVA